MARLALWIALLSACPLESFAADGDFECFTILEASRSRGRLLLGPPPENGTRFALTGWTALIKTDEDYGSIPSAIFEDATAYAKSRKETLHGKALRNAPLEVIVNVIKHAYKKAPNRVYRVSYLPEPDGVTVIVSDSGPGRSVACDNAEICEIFLTAETDEQGRMDPAAEEAYLDEYLKRLEGSSGAGTTVLSGLQEQGVLRYRAYNLIGRLPGHRILGHQVELHFPWQRTPVELSAPQPVLAGATAP